VKMRDCNGNKRFNVLKLVFMSTAGKPITHRAASLVYLLTRKREYRRRKVGDKPESLFKLSEMKYADEKNRKWIIATVRAGMESSRERVQLLKRFSNVLAIPVVRKDEVTLSKDRTRYWFFIQDYLHGMNATPS